MQQGQENLPPSPPPLEEEEVDTNGYSLTPHLPPSSFVSPDIPLFPQSGDQSTQTDPNKNIFGHHYFQPSSSSSSPSTYHQNGGNQQLNGQTNGEVPEKVVSRKTLDQKNQDIVRLIGQHLKTIGLQ